MAALDLQDDVVRRGGLACGEAHLPVFRSGGGMHQPEVRPAARLHDVVRHAHG